MDQREHRNDGHESAVNSVAAYLHDELGLEDRAARASATSIVENAPEVVAPKRIESPRTWWALALRGILAIVVGAVFLAQPHASITVAVLVIGAWILVDGIVGLVSAFTQEERSRVTAPVGAIGAVIGYLILTRTGTATLVLFILIAAWALARGAAEIGLSARMRRGEPGRASLAFLGIASFLFGLLLLTAPMVGVIALGWWIGLYAILYGVVEVIRSVQVHRVTSYVHDAWSPRRVPHPA
jgi:uncharacterized membrane protein HdeD (DUF308 family)